jgi:branched-chain amino acid transport system substrate-binding protein
LENTLKPWTIIVIALTLLLTACTNWDNPKVARAQRAASASGDIVIGAVWPWGGGKGALWEGIELAVEEINAGGGVLKRKLRIVKEDDESSLTKGRLIAQEFAENPDMVAVIGHLNSYVALPATSIYQSAGLVYLTPGATNYKLNSQGYDLAFRTIPSNRSISRRMADDMAAQGHRRLAIYYLKDKNNQDMANYFEQRARDLGLTIVDRRSYIQGSEDFSDAIQRWKDLYQFDALFLAATMPESAYFIAQARKMGLNVPIFGSESIDSHWLMETAGAAAEGVVLPEFVVRDDTLPAYRHFSEIFMRKYGRPPSAIAAQGYDTVHVLAQAIDRANSSVPDKIAQALHNTRKWQGVTGEYTFDGKGDIPDKTIAIKVVRDGKLEAVR